MACWAECLGGCGGKSSREHIISQSLFISRKVRVQGLSWCREESKEIGLGSLTAKVLCQLHNSQLHEVDTAGGEAFDAFRQFTRISNEREKNPPKIWSLVEHSIDGTMLERWFLKTLIILSFGGRMPIGTPSAPPGCPDARLVGIAYGQRKFEGRAGLYFVVGPGVEVDSDDTVQFVPVIKDGAYIIGGLFRFRGHRFVLCLDEAGPPIPMSGVGMNGEDWGKFQLNFHNVRIDQRTETVYSQVIHIAWDETERSPTVASSS